MENIKRKEAETVKRSVPEVFGDGKIEVFDNYVSFPVPLSVFKKIRAWLDHGDRKFDLATCSRNKFHPYENIKLLILNIEEQKVYEATGRH
jgi:hypothetical protein